MLLTTIRCVLFSAAFFCAAAVAQLPAAESSPCGSAERMAFAPIAGRGIAELRGLLFAKKQLDQLARFLESGEGGPKWNGATEASQLKLIEAAARSATNSSVAVAQLPFLPSTRYAFEGLFPFECSKSAQLLEQMRTPGFTRYLEVRARVAAAASAWYASGLYAKLTHHAAPPLLQPLVAAPADATAKAAPAKAAPAKVAYSKGRPLRPIKPAAKPKAKSAAKTTAAERQAVLAKRVADVDLILREIGLFNVGMTPVDDDVLRTGALASAPAALVAETVEALADPALRSLLLDPAYVAFSHAVKSTAHKTEPLLMQDYPHLEPLGRDVSQAWVADLLRAAPKPPSTEQKSGPVAPIAPIAPVGPVAPKS